MGGPRLFFGYAVLFAFNGVVCRYPIGTIELQGTEKWFEIHPKFLFMRRQVIHGPLYRKFDSADADHNLQ